MLLQVGAQGVVHAGLPAFASRAERLKHVSVIADADLFFRVFLRGPTHTTGRAEWLQFGDLTRAQFIRVRVGGDAAIDCSSSSGVGGMSLRFLNITDLSAVCLTQADNVHALATLREHNAVQAILDHGVADLAREDEKHAVLADIAGVFGGIEGNFHSIY